MKNLFKMILSLGLFFTFTSCASLFTKDDNEQKPKSTPSIINKADPVQVSNAQDGAAVTSTEAGKEESSESTSGAESLVRFSDESQLAPPSDRSYKRMTRQKMEEDSELYSSAGSLWKMEGQSSYLFVENKNRREGDPTSIKLEGPAMKSLENKVAVVVDLMKELEAQKKKAEEEAKRAEEEKKRLALIEEEKKMREERIARGEAVYDAGFDQTYDPFYSGDRAPASEEKAANNKAPAEEKVDLKEVEFIPSRIVEKMADGMYRIRGQQYLTIKKKPYKVIATALVRAEDFKDNEISSNKLLDPQFDVIHVKRTVQ